MTITETDTTRALPETRDPSFWDGRQRSYIPRDPLPLPEGLRLHGATADEVDPVTHEVVRYALLAANFEHSALLQRLYIGHSSMMGAISVHPICTTIPPHLPYTKGLTALRKTVRHIALKVSVAATGYILAGVAPTELCKRLPRPPLTFRSRETAEF